MLEFSSLQAGQMCKKLGGMQRFSLHTVIPGGEINVSALGYPCIAQPFLRFYFNLLIFQTPMHFWTLLGLTEPLFDLHYRPQGA